MHIGDQRPGPAERVSPAKALNSKKKPAAGHKKGGKAVGKHRLRRSKDDDIDNDESSEIDGDDWMDYDDAEALDLDFKDPNLADKPKAVKVELEKKPSPKKHEYEKPSQTSKEFKTLRIGAEPAKRAAAAKTNPSSAATMSPAAGKHAKELKNHDDALHERRSGSGEATAKKLSARLTRSKDATEGDGGGKGAKPSSAAKRRLPPLTLNITTSRAIAPKKPKELDESGSIDVDGSFEPLEYTPLHTPLLTPTFAPTSPFKTLPTPSSSKEPSPSVAAKFIDDSKAQRPIKDLLEAIQNELAKEDHVDVLAPAAAAAATATMTERKVVEVPVIVNLKAEEENDDDGEDSEDHR